MVEKYITILIVIIVMIFIILSAYSINRKNNRYIRAWKKKMKNNQNKK